MESLERGQRHQMLLNSQKEITSNSLSSPPKTFSTSHFPLNARFCWDVVSIHKVLKVQLIKNISLGGWWGQDMVFKRERAGINAWIAATHL